MKKTLTLMFTLCVAVMLFTACGSPSGTVEQPSEPTEHPSCEHSWAEATCTTPKTCTLCKVTEGKAKGHTEVVVAGKEATCTDTGLTEGKKCSSCGEITVAQQTIPAKGHVEVTVAGKEVTCTENGLTEGKKCSVCGTVTVKQEAIVATGHKDENNDIACDVCKKNLCEEHKAEILAGKEATCTETGLTEGKKCSVCNEILVKQEVIAAKGHTEEVVAGKAATCTEAGITDGKKCTTCGVVTVEQEAIAATGHKDENNDYKCDECELNLCEEHIEEVIAGKEATCTETGLTAGKKCSICGVITVKQEIVAAKGHTEETVAGKAPTCTETGLTDGKKCATCGVVTVEQTIIDANGHDPETVAGKEATCTETGLKDGKKCSVCGDILEEQEVIPVKDHEQDEDDGDITTAVTCKHCDHVFIEAKEAIALTLPEVTNGTISTDKKQYEPGETVTLTITPADGYVQKLYINGEPLLLDWKTNTYSFKTSADAKTFEITGNFVEKLGFETNDNYDTANEAHGIIKTHYTGTNSTWFGIKGKSEVISMTVTDDMIACENGVKESFVMLGIRIGDVNYSYRLTNKNGTYYWQRNGFNGKWDRGQLDADAIAALQGDGVEFRLERTAADTLSIYVNGKVCNTYTMEGVTADTEAQRLFVMSEGRPNEYIDIPFEVNESPIFAATSGSWDLYDQYDGSLTILNKTADGSKVVTNANTYTEATVTVKDYTSDVNTLSMQIGFIFSDGKMYEVRVDHTHSSGAYRIQNVDGSIISGWTSYHYLTADEIEDITTGDGLKFTVKLVGSSVELYVNDTKVGMQDLGSSYDGQTAQIQFCMNGNKTGGNIELPFEVK